MKFLSLSLLLLVLYVTYTTAQWQNCHNRSWLPTCVLPGSQGHRGPGCPSPTVLWYYDRNIRQCRSMLYLGCGGNNNRWCTRDSCVRSCQRW